MELADKQLALRLRELRQRRGLSQADLARRLGWDARRISLWERGRGRPGPAEMARLGRALGVQVGPVPAGADFPPFDDLPLPAPRASGGGLRQAAQAYPGSVARLLQAVSLRPDRDLCEEWLSLANPGSALQAVALLQWLAADLLPVQKPPQRCGFRTHPVIDPGSRLVVGDRPRAALAGDRYLIFPEVTLLGPAGLVRVDLLTGVWGSSGPVWKLALLCEGGRSFAASSLGLPRLRFEAREVLDPGFPKAFREALGLPRAA